MLKKLDIYIIRKFLGTFVVSIILIMGVIIAIDFTEKMDKFDANDAPGYAIVFDYYLNLIPFFFNMLSPLFTFIAVIFITSKMAGNSEIIAMQASGMSYNRLLRPYFISAALIAVFTFVLSGYVIPHSNQTRLDFEDKYVKSFKQEDVANVQLEVEKGIILYIGYFDALTNTGSRVSLERFDDKKLVSRMTADRITMDTIFHWKMHNYLIRRFDGMHETIERGEVIDTIIPIDARDFFITAKESAQMSNPELKDYLDRQAQRGIGNLKAFQNEYHRRFSNAFASFILTLIGVSLSARKVRGGTGANLGIGLALSALYMLFMTFASSFSTNGVMPPMLAAWLPNITYACIAAYLYRKAPK